VRRRNEPFKLFMQNKPNFRKTQINVTSVTLNSYKQIRPYILAKANTIKANKTQLKANKSQFQKRPKMSVNKALTTDYENIPPHSRAENKPNQTQFYRLTAKVGLARALSCIFPSASSATTAPKRHRAISFCVSQISPCKARNKSAAVPVAAATHHSRSS